MNLVLVNENIIDLFMYFYLFFMLDFVCDVYVYQDWFGEIYVRFKFIFGIVFV